jgi:hypothetical protein
MRAIVVPILSQWEPLEPFRRAGIDKTTKGLIQPLRPPICLRVVAGTHMQFHPSHPEEFLPELAGENFVPI